METLVKESIVVVYEDGVLRPLSPLSLPEHTQICVQIVSKPSSEQHLNQRVHQALVNAGVIQPRVDVEPLPCVSESELLAAADALALAGPLSELIIAEREG